MQFIQDMQERIKKIETDLNNTMIAMKKVEEQIAIFNQKGKELAAHATYLKGQLDILKEFTKE